MFCVAREDRGGARRGGPAGDGPGPVTGGGAAGRAAGPGRSRAGAARVLAGALTRSLRVYRSGTVF